MATVSERFPEEEDNLKDGDKTEAHAESHKTSHVCDKTDVTCL